VTADNLARFRNGPANKYEPARWLVAFSIALILLIAGCATPVQVEQIDPRAAQRELTSNVISTGDLSEPTQIVLHRQDLTEAFASDPEAAIASLHRTATAGPPDPDALFALSEMSLRHAQDTGRQTYYLAAAVYAFAFLFPDDPAQRPDRFDPRLRIASDLYNRGLTSGFASADRSRVLLRSGRYALPFGTIDVTYDSAAARWGNLALVDFTPADELQIKGLQNRYRQRGIGVSLAADAPRSVEEKGFQVAPEVKVPVTALLRIDLSRRDLAQGHLRGTIDVYPAFEPSTVEIRDQSVPLEVDASAAFAYGLSDPAIWKSEFGGFLSGDYFNKDRFPIDGLEPYRPGQIPVIFIHGTASSSGRWADLVNDLQSDPAVREHYQFWWFSYSTGKPTPFSALQLRTAIKDAVHELDPQGRDPALRQIVLIGHSQGGLLAKFLVIKARRFGLFGDRSDNKQGGLGTPYGNTLSRRKRAGVVSSHAGRQRRWANRKKQKNVRRNSAQRAFRQLASAALGMAESRHPAGHARNGPQGPAVGGHRLKAFPPCDDCAASSPAGRRRRWGA
jgi:pimeloyl-ACP methyl ester carboxylesterase